MPRAHTSFGSFDDPRLDGAGHTLGLTNGIHGYVAGLVHVPELPERVFLRVPVGPARAQSVSGVPTSRTDGRQ